MVSISRRHFGLATAGASIALAGVGAGGGAAAAPAADGVPAQMLDARRYRLKAKAVDETYRIDVLPVISPFAPPAPGAKLPVVFVLDGNWMFPMLGSTALILALGMIPSILVVGIGYELDLSKGIGAFYGELTARRTRDYTPSLDKAWFNKMKAKFGSPNHPYPSYGTPGGAKAFLAFLNDELKPFVAVHYPNADMDDVTIAGDSFGSLFALYALFTAPSSFQRYIASDPSLWWDSGMMFKLAKNLGDSKAHLFMSVGGEEPQGKMIGSIKKMDALFTDGSHQNLHYAFHLFEGENHGSVIPAALSRGLREVFKKQA